MENNDTCAPTNSATQLHEEQDVQFLTTLEVAELLNLPETTVTKLAREGKIPGKRYGRYWRFLLDELLLHHRENAVATGRKELLNSHGSISEIHERELVRGVLVSGTDDGEIEEIPPFDWTKDFKKACAEA